MKNSALRLIFSTLLILTLAACGQDEENGSGLQSVDDVNLDPLDAELIIPDKAELDESVVFQALVTQGEDVVDDASEVIYEIWADGEKSVSEMIEADLPGEDGVYEVSYTFSEEKLYHVQSHVTARGSHVMPVKEIVIGDPDLEEENDEAEEHDSTGNNHDHAHDENNQGENENENHNDHHLDESIDLRWKTPEKASASEDVSLSVEVDLENNPWTEGKVQFEVWKHGDDRHEWISAVETDPGIYEIEYVFEESGEFHIMVHLEDDELHEHIQFLIEIE